MCGTCHEWWNRLSNGTAMQPESGTTVQISGIASATIDDTVQDAPKTVTEDTIYHITPRTVYRAV